MPRPNLPVALSDLKETLLPATSGAPWEMLTPLLMVESWCFRDPTWDSRLAPEEHLAKAAACDSFSRCRTMASQPSHSAMVCS